MAKLNKKCFIVIFMPINVFVVNFIALVNSMPSAGIPIVVNTWDFTNGTVKAWDVVFREGKTALDAIEAGCTQCELEQCDYTVGFGGSPDEDGETTLDAMIIDGPTHDVGAVADLRRVKSAISVARGVLHYTNHTLLVGDQATKFAISMGFKEENLSTPYSIEMWKNWKKHNCQPSFWKNVLPDPRISCGPFKPVEKRSVLSIEKPNFGSTSMFGHHNHDTIGMIVIDQKGNLAAGTSSNGAKFKIPGRVGDSPIPGAGAYVDQDIGAAAATGDGDVMMRFLPSYQTVENMRNGMDPMKAAENSVHRIIKKYPAFSGAIIAAASTGEFGAACHGMESFPFSVMNKLYKNVTVKRVTCINT